MHKLAIGLEPTAAVCARQPAVEAKHFQNCARPLAPQHAHMSFGSCMALVSVFIALISECSVEV